MERIEHFEFPEGATPITDCSGLIPHWVHHLNDLNRVEAENILKAQRKYLQDKIEHPTDWFHIGELKVIHKNMFSDVWEWAGILRKSITSIGIEPTLIPVQLAEFCHVVHSWFQYPTELTFVEMSARIHHRLVAIHPFENGNGRFSRLVADCFLLACECPYPIWPNSLNQEGSSRKEYIQSLKNADKGDYSLLLEFMKRFGAKDPTLSELLRNNFYRVYISDKDKGIFLVKALLRNGENPNNTTANGHRALHLAVKSDLKNIVKLLVNAGAEIDACDKSGLTPFQIAVTRENKELADFFLSKGARSIAPPGLGYVQYYKLYQK